MSAVFRREPTQFRREPRQAIPLGADADFTPEAAATAATIAHAELAQALGSFSRENLREGLVFLERAQRSIDHSVYVLEFLQRGVE